MQRRGPYFLITALLLILFFIVGIRYGQRIEKTNTEVSLLRLTTTPSPSPSIDLSDFEKYESKLCDLEFLYPSKLDIINETTASSELVSEKDIVFSFLCDMEETEEVLFKTASPESGM